MSDFHRQIHEAGHGGYLSVVLDCAFRFEYGKTLVGSGDADRGDVQGRNREMEMHREDAETESHIHKGDDYMTVAGAFDRGGLVL